MKAKTWRFNIALFSLVILPLLLTSCLADLLNKHFGYELPIYLSYYSDYGDAPSRKRIESGYILTEEDLPAISADNNEFLGWYLDKTWTSPANSGMMLYDSITLYARWRYNNSSNENKTPYLVQIHIFDPSNGKTTFTSDTYWTFINEDEIEDFTRDFDVNLERIPSLDYIHYENNYYYGPDGNNYCDDVYVVDLYYYSKYTTLDSLPYYEQLQYYGLTLNLYLKEYIPSGFAMSSITGLPPVNLHLEESSINVIGSGSFKECNWLKEIYFPDTLIMIESNAFKQCVNLEYVHFPDSANVDTIGESAFASCANLKDFKIPDSVTILGSSASGYVFDGCTSLTSIKIPKNSSLTSIKSGTFMNCSNLTTVYIPKNIKNIGSIAFYGTNLTDVYYEGSESDRSDSTFQINDDRIKNTDLVTWHYNAY
ncbi:MAG: leucine-rich repeat domain-containing protein [Treponema sp.]|nr:leucine-rich repeat domain-containing protein [Treponema sp.]